MDNFLYTIHNFFFNYYISSYFVGFYRILTVSILLSYLAYIHKDLINFSKHDGIFPYSDYKSLSLSYGISFSIFNYCSFYYLNYIIIYLFYISGVFAIIGLFTNFSLLIFIFCLLSLQSRISPILSSGGDVIANVVLWSLFFINSGAALSLDSIIFSKHEYINGWSFRLIQITISFGFLSAGIIKLLSRVWRNGVALRNAILYTNWSKDGTKNLFKNKIFYLCANYSVIIYQVLAPILFWVPNFTIYGIIFGTLLHFSMIITLKIGYFAPITIVAILSFLANYFQQ